MSPRLSLGLEAGHPLAQGLDTDARCGSELAHRPARPENAADRFRSTQRRQPSIPVAVHPILARPLKFHDSSFLCLDRMESLWKDHSWTISNSKGTAMTGTASQFTGGIPENYGTGLGPNIFQDYAADLARRAGATAAHSVLELAARTGIAQASRSSSPRPMPWRCPSRTRSSI